MDNTPPLPKGPVIAIVLMAVSLFAFVMIVTNLLGYQANLSQAKEKYEQQIAAVLHTVRVVFVVPAIELCNFIAAVQHGETLQECHSSVQQQVALHGIIQCDLIVLFQCLFDTAQAGSGTAAAGIAGGRVS